MEDPTPTMEESVINEVVNERNLISNPYSQFDTLVEKLDTLYPYLISVAREQDKRTYKEVSQECGIFTARLSYLLGIVGLIEDRNSRPPLPAVVKRTNEDMVGGKYFRMIEMAENYKDSIPESPDKRSELWHSHHDDVHSHWKE